MEEAPVSAHPYIFPTKPARPWTMCLPTSSRNRKRRVPTPPRPRPRSMDARWRPFSSAQYASLRPGRQQLAGHQRRRHRRTHEPLIREWMDEHFPALLEGAGTRQKSPASPGRAASADPLSTARHPGRAREARLGRVHLAFFSRSRIAPAGRTGVASGIQHCGLDPTLRLIKTGPPRGAMLDKTIQFPKTWKGAFTPSDESGAFRAGAAGCRVRSASSFHRQRHRPRLSNIATPEQHLQGALYSLTPGRPGVCDIERANAGQGTKC